LGGKIDNGTFFISFPEQRDHFMGEVCHGINVHFDEFLNVFQGQLIEQA